jgi:HEPN domain-containing protein
MNGRAADYQAWLEKAAEDRLYIENEMRAERKPWSVICFCAQQAAEKHLKAFLAHQGELPEKIHDLNALLSACATHDATLADLENDCRALNSYSVDIAILTSTSNKWTLKE